MGILHPPALERTSTMMSGFRTPTGGKADAKPPMTEKAGPSGIAGSGVRKSIGEIEARQRAPLHPTKASADKSSGVLTSQKTVGARYLNRTSEAKALLMSAKMQLGSARNLKTEIKVAVTDAIDGLFRLIKEAEEESKGKGKTGKSVPEENLTKDVEDDLPCSMEVATSEKHEAANHAQTYTTAVMKELIQKLSENHKVVSECNEQTAALTRKLEQTPTYANVLTGPPQKRELNQPATMHSVVVSSTDEMDTGDEVLEKIRKAVNAKEEGLRVERVRKGKDGKVIMGCRTKEDLGKIKERLDNAKDVLKTENMKNKDPLVILKDVLNYHTDAEVIDALKKQNPHHFRDLEEEDRVEIRYRRKARNPHMAHIVLKVSPVLWNRLTNAETVYLDLQRVKVSDQSPLIQCTRCLGYGHGKRHCTETETVCSHCGGPHLKSACEEWKAGANPSCYNCKLAKTDETQHNAFSNQCPIRSKWDQIARSAVAYC